MLNMKMSNTDWGVIRNTKDCLFNLLFNFPKANFVLEWYDRKYIDYILKMILLHPYLVRNVRVIFKLCSLLITTITYLTSTKLDT